MPSPGGSPNSKMPPWLLRGIVIFWAGYVLVYVGTGLVRALRSLLVVMVVAIFISFAIEPAVNRLEKWKIRRGVGVWIVYLVMFAAIAGFSAAVGTALADQVNSLVRQAPVWIQDIENWLQASLGASIDLQSVQQQFVTGGGINTLAQRFATDLVNLSTTLLNAILQAFTILLFTFYLVAEGPKLRRNVSSLLPLKRRQMVLNVWDLAIEKTGGYVLSRSVLAVASALVHWVAFQIIGVPFPIPLALWVGVISQFIPAIGTYIAGALPLLVALLDQPRSALWVLIVIVLYQQLENYFFSPRLTAQTMEIHVAVAFGSVLAGAAVLGVVGALVALPFAATVQAVISGYLHHRHEPLEA